MTWNGVDLENTAQPKYLGVTFDRTLRYKQHIHNTKMKVATRSNLLKKLASSKWGGGIKHYMNNGTGHVLLNRRMCAPVWARSSHADILDPKLNKA